MKELFLKADQISSYVAKNHAKKVLDPQRVFRNGREFVLHTYLVPIKPLLRLINIILTSTITLLTAFLALAVPNFRRFWSESLSGKEKHILLTNIAINTLLKEIRSQYQESTLKNYKQSVSAIVTECLKQFQGYPEWEGIASDYKTLGPQDLVGHISLFWKTASNFKDYKKPNPDKVLEKIDADIPLNDEKKFLDNPPYLSGLITKEERKIGGYAASTRSAQGIRPTMEDESAQELLRIESLDGVKMIPYFAVFDGHGGDQCSHFLKEEFTFFLQDVFKHKDLNCPIQVNSAFKEAFVKVSRAYQHVGKKDGSTAVVAMIIDNVLWIANAGDSRAVANIGGEAFQLSQDAYPKNPRFKKGVESRGGLVYQKRVGGLAMARAIGDEIQGVTARPKVKRFFLSKLDPKKTNQLILACDGLFDVMNSKEVVELAHGCSSVEAADLLINQAFMFGTTDNVTVTVIDLNPKRF